MSPCKCGKCAGPTDLGYKCYFQYPEPQLAVVEPEPEALPFITPILDGDGNDTGLVCVFPGEDKGKKLQAERLAKAKRRYPL